MVPLLLPLPPAVAGSYHQWRKNGKNISGATGSSYTLSEITTANAGTYTVVATNLLGSGTSNSAVLTVTAATSPDPRSGLHDATGEQDGHRRGFSDIHSGRERCPEKPTYQWGKNGTSIPGATGASSTTGNVSTGSAGTYTVVATNSKGKKMSNGAVLTATFSPPSRPTLRPSRHNQRARRSSPGIQ